MGVLPPRDDPFWSSPLEFEARCILCGPVNTPGMWAHFNSESHQTMVLLNMQAEIALPEELRR